jgi:hypothetical protein
MRVPVFVRMCVGVFVVDVVVSMSVLGPVFVFVLMFVLVVIVAVSVLGAVFVLVLVLVSFGHRVLLARRSGLGVSPPRGGASPPRLSPNKVTAG